MRSRLVATLVAVLAVGAAASAAPAGSGSGPRATAGVVAGSSGDALRVGARNDERVSDAGAVALPGVSIGAGEAIAESAPGVAGEGSRSAARARVVARDVDLLDGLVTAALVRREASAADGVVAYRGIVRKLRIGGELVGDVAQGRGFALPDGAGSLAVNLDGRGLQLRLERAVGDVPAGSVIAVADVDAAAAAPEPTPEPTPDATSEPPDAREPAETPPPPQGETAEPSRQPTQTAGAARTARRRLTAAGFVFPIYGETSISDGFGAPRSHGPHEGNDLFAAFGAPVLAVTDGTVEKVGTLPLSGNRLWLRSEHGDAFFYAHLSSFAADAVDGRRVRAGTVLGFVGNTGNAELTPPHLHFEIHPDGGSAIDPFAVLSAWQRGIDALPDGAWLSRHGEDTEQRPGALVPVRDLIAD